MNELEIPPRPAWLPKRKPQKSTWTRSHDSAIDFARQFDLSVDAIVELMPAAWAQLMAIRDQRTPARQTACRLTGLNARRCNQWEDSGKDHSTRPGFDCSARTVVFEHPELGLNPDDTDTPGEIWELIKSGADAPLLKSGPECAQLAAEWLKARHEPEEIEFAEWIDETGDADDSIDGDCSFNVDDFADPVPVETETAVPSSAMETDTRSEGIPDTVAREANNAIDHPRDRLVVWPSRDVPPDRQRYRSFTVRRRARPLSMRRLRPVTAKGRLADSAGSRGPGP